MTTDSFSSVAFASRCAYTFICTSFITNSIWLSHQRSSFSDREALLCSALLHLIDKPDGSPISLVRLVHRSMYNFRILVSAVHNYWRFVSYLGKFRFLLVDHVKTWGFSLFAVLNLTPVNHRCKVTAQKIISISAEHGWGATVEKMVKTFKSLVLSDHYHFVTIILSLVLLLSFRTWWKVRRWKTWRSRSFLSTKPTKPNHASAVEIMYVNRLSLLKTEKN